MSGRVEIGSKRSRNCVSPAPAADEDGPSSKSCGGDTTTTTKAGGAPANMVWKQWTSNFRKTRRLKNDLIAEEGIDATVERHMTLKKKRSLMDDDDSDSDDEGNYYKLDVPPPQLRQHPLEFTPSGFLPRLGPQQVTPVSCDPDALPTCSLRRYGHGDEDDDFYFGEDRIPPPPPSFHRYPSKKRAVGLGQRPDSEQRSSMLMMMAPPPFHSTRGVSSSLAVEKEGPLKKGGDNNHATTAMPLFSKAPSLFPPALSTSTPLSLAPPSLSLAPPKLGLGAAMNIINNKQQPLAVSEEDKTESSSCSNSEDKLLA